MARNVNPSIIIGLGGSGYKTLFEVKKSLLREYGEVPKCIKLLCFDTDVKPLKNKVEEVVYSQRIRGTMDREPEAPHKVKFDKDEGYAIPIRDPKGIFNADFIKPWLSDWAKALIGPSSSGASCIRQKGRFAFFENFQNIGAKGSGIQSVISKTSKAINDINLQIDDYYNITTGTEAGDNSKPIVHLVFSPSGGTGGGTFLDFIMLIKSMPENFRLCTYMIMPSFYEHYQGTENVRANSYAAFKEIDHLMGQDAEKMGHKWSNYSMRNPWKFSWTGGGNPLPMDKYAPLFDLGMIFDNKLENNSTLSNPGEVYRRIGEILYTVTSGAASAIDSILSNAEVHFTWPSSTESGKKRRNYFASGIANIEIDPYRLRSFRRKSYLEYAFQQYLSGQFEGGTGNERSEGFIKSLFLAERGNDNEIIDKLYDYENKSDELRTLIPLVSPKSDTNNISSYVLSQGQKEIADKRNSIKTQSTENADNIISDYKKNFDETLQKDLKATGGLQGSLDFIDSQISYFNVIKKEMTTESEEHDAVYENKTNGETGAESIINIRIQSILNAEEHWNPLTKQKNIEESIESYCRELITQLRENGESIRKKVCGDKVCKVILDHLQSTKKKLEQFKNVLSLSRNDNKTSLDQLRYHGKSIIKHKFPLNSYLYEKEEQGFNKELQELCYSELRFEDLKDMSDSVKILEKLEDQIISQDRKEIEVVKNIRDVIREMQLSQDETILTEAVNFLDATSMVCAKVERSWSVGVQNPLRINILTMPMPNNIPEAEKKDIDWFIGKSQLEIDSNGIIESNDLYKITLMQFQGPFPAMAVSGFNTSKDKYIDFTENLGTFHHIDKQHQGMMDLFKDDSAEDALLYFGLGSILPQPLIYSESRKYWFDDGTGTKKPMSEARSDNNNCRAHAFNYFKKVKEWVELIQNKVNEFEQKDPIGFKKLLLDHFDLISMNKGSRLKHNLNDPNIERRGEIMTSKKFLGGKAKISERRESDHIIIERRRIVQYAVDTFSMEERDYLYREVDGEMKERWSKSDLQELGAMQLLR